jgi:hypothetical protein
MIRTWVRLVKEDRVVHYDILLEDIYSYGIGFAKGFASTAKFL